MQKLKDILKEYAAVLVLFFYYVFCLSPLPFVQYSDGYVLWLPRFIYVVNQVLAGHFPLLNPFQFCGNWLFADGTTNFLNPTFLFYLFLKPQWAYTVSVLLLFLILLLGIWKYFREKEFSYKASIIGTVGYAFGGQILFWSLYHGMNFVFALFPWILYFFTKYEKTLDKKWKILSFLSIFLISLGGFVQFVVISLAAFFAEGLKDFSLKSFKETLKNRGLELTLGFLSASVIIIPTVEAVINSNRKIMPYVEGLIPRDVFLLGIMGFFGDSGKMFNYPNYFFYAGIFIFILAFYYLRTNFKQTIKTPIVALSLIFPITVFIVLLNILPENFQMGISSDPFRGMFVFIFALSLLAAKAMEALIEQTENKNNDFEFPLEFKIGLVINLCLTLLFSLIITKVLNLFSLYIYFLITSFLLFAGLILEKYKKNSLIIYWIIFSVCLNCVFSAREYLSTNIYHNFTNLAEIRKHNGLPLEILQKGSRVLDNSEWAFFFEDWAQAYNIRSIGGYATLEPREYFLRVKKDNLLSKKYNATSTFKNNNSINPQTLAKYGVEYLISDNHSMMFLENNTYPFQIDNLWNKQKKELERQGWKAFLSYNGGILYKNPYYVGRAYLTDPKGKVLREANIVEDLNGKITLNFNSSKDERLILADSWILGWNCYDNGIKVKGYNADGFLGYKIPSSGYHKIQWKYEPLSIKIGFSLSLISFMIYFLLNFKRIKYE